MVAWDSSRSPLAVIGEKEDEFDDFEEDEELDEDDYGDEDDDENDDEDEADHASLIRLSVGLDCKPLGPVAQLVRAHA